MFHDMYITMVRRIDDTIVMDFSFKADANDSDYELYIYYPCPLRISRGNDIILGSFDIDCVINETDDDSWNIKDNNMYDINVRDRILPVLPQKVTASKFSEIGDIRIDLENGMILEIFIQACTNDDIEDWRFIDCINDEQYYFVNHLLKKAENEEDFDDQDMHVWNMVYWKRFYKQEDIRSGLRLHCDKTLDSQVKRACKEFCAWLRANYTFPLRVNIYLKDSDRIRASDGELVYGIWYKPYDKYKEPYIKIAAGDFNKLLKERGRDNALASYLFDIAHELTHYFQWINSLKLKEEAEESQAERYSRMIVYDYAEVKEHP